MKHKIKEFFTGEKKEKDSQEKQKELFLASDEDSDKSQKDRLHSDAQTTAKQPPINKEANNLEDTASSNDTNNAILGIPNLNNLNARSDAVGPSAALWGARPPLSELNPEKDHTDLCVPRGEVITHKQ